MMRDLLIDAAATRSLMTPRVLRIYRAIRERLGDDEVADFEPVLVAETARLAGCPAEWVGATVAEWIDRRPLRHLRACRYPGLDALFAGLKQSGKLIGVLSDYPAREKIRALDLAADVVVHAGDDEIRRLKPHPRGLEVLAERAGVATARTLLIGDRVERDGFAARRAGARCLIRSRKERPGWVTFARFDAPLFAPVLAECAA